MKHNFPPWKHHRRKFGSHKWRKHMHDRRFRRGYMFFWLAFVFGFMMLLVIGAITVISTFIGLILGGRNPSLGVVSVVCCLSFLFPMVGWLVAARAFRSVAQPLSDLIDAAQAVAEGNLSVRVPETAPGNFGELSQTFNRMIAEIERIDEQRRNLTADVAHELRTPLHIIQGNLEGILDGVYDPTPDHINSILDDTRLLSRLIEDLRTLAMAESGQLPLECESVSVQDLLTDALTSFSGHADTHKICLEIAEDNNGKNLTIHADLRRLNQILGNLIMNAIRHTPPNGKITLAAYPTQQGVQLKITDTGHGISPEDLPHIFDRFWRGDKSRTHKEGVGGGLGLAITQQLVQLHGGTITVSSELEAGTTFTLNL